MKIEIENMAKIKTMLVNLLGVLLALGIALGGVYGMQSRLAQEEAELLRGGGRMELPVQDDAADAENAGAEASERTLLTEEELAQAVRDLQNGKETYPHEPRQGQLSMTEAVGHAVEWMEGFFMPHLGIPASNLAECSTDCYLWARQEGFGYGGEETAPFSYWTVTLGSRRMEAELILNAASGQILDATVSFSFQQESPDGETLMAFLQDYADSFGLEESDSLFISEKEARMDNPHTFCQSIGGRGVFGVVNTGSTTINWVNTDGELVEYAEIFNLHLFLTLEQVQIEDLQ